MVTPEMFTQARLFFNGRNAAEKGRKEMLPDGSVRGGLARLATGLAIVGVIVTALELVVAGSGHPILAGCFMASAGFAR